MVKLKETLEDPGFEVARVLLADDDPASRLTLQTVLRAGGYRVDSAASAAEALGKLDEQEYELVLADLHMESPESGLKVLARARMMDYKPATALLATYNPRQSSEPNPPTLVEPENLPELMDYVAGLISQRASRRLRRAMRQAS
ncbi:MAG: response regulator [Acidobacteria bacterium]|nr:response regulator [Acidobacteriota bacterium]